MKLKIVDNGDMKYPEVINAETGEKVDGILSIDYHATVSGRVIVIELIGEVELKADFREIDKR